MKILQYVINLILANLFFVSFFTFYWAEANDVSRQEPHDDS
jgi:hypothetical protein